jgi:hypothetical protein
MNADENKMLIGVYLRLSAFIGGHQRLFIASRRSHRHYGTLHPSRDRWGAVLRGAIGFRERNQLARGLQEAHAAGGPTGLQPLVGLLLFLRGYDGLTCVAAFPDSRTRHEFSGATAALFRHGLL